MIGQRLNHHFILAASPSTNDLDSMVILAVEIGEDRGYEPYVVAHLYGHQLPVPTSWDNGYYHQRLEDAVERFTSFVPTDTTRLAAGLSAISGHFAPRPVETDDGLLCVVCKHLGPGHHGEHVVPFISIGTFCHENPEHRGYCVHHRTFHSQES